MLSCLFSALNFIRDIETEREAARQAEGIHSPDAYSSQGWATLSGGGVRHSVWVSYMVGRDRGEDWGHLLLLLRVCWPWSFITRRAETESRHSEMGAGNPSCTGTAAPSARPSALVLAVAQLSGRLLTWQTCPAQIASFVLFFQLWRPWFRADLLHMKLCKAVAVLSLGIELCTVPIFIFMFPSLIFWVDCNVLNERDHIFHFF